MPKVSIVLPNYNYARYLDERIQSLLNQTYKDFELIILDDASTDNSVEIIGKYTAEPRVKTKFYSENSGLPYQRWNDGAEMAQGEYLLIAGADDSCHPTLLEKLVDKLDNNPSVGLAFSQSWEVDDDGKIIRSMKEWTDDLNQERWAEDFVDDGKNECQYLLFKNTIPNASPVLMRYRIFNEAGKFDTQIRLAADWMLWARMLLISDIAFVAEPLNNFRTHQNTVRSTTKAGLFIEECSKTIRYVAKNIQLPQNVLEKAANNIISSWLDTYYSHIEFSQNIRIYRILSDAFPRTNYYILRKILEKPRLLKEIVKNIIKTAKLPKLHKRLREYAN
jgi:glycosyltransferase involved in cell wall biosynthesis